MPDNPNVRVRFAPSPTGHLHIGGLRTALYNYLFARANNGTMILRIEDTDRTRFVADAEANILKALEWTSLTYDEGPGVGGPHGPYHQSGRTALYQREAQRLLDAGHAYYAFDTEEELQRMRDDASVIGAVARYDAATRGAMRNQTTLTTDETRRLLADNTPHVVRLMVPPGERVEFRDVVRGAVEFSTDEVDDQILMKSDGLPTYHLANVVDDHDMEISHVIRGEEWLPSTPKHILLYRFLGWTAPIMAHLPLILSPSGGKLSKRKADKAGIPVWVREYEEQGYEPAALLNYLAFLGWNPGTEEEIFSVDELAKVFSLERVGSAGVKFDMSKLDWYNAHYVRAMAVEELAQKTQPAVAAKGWSVDSEYLVRVAALMQDRLTRVAELPIAGALFFTDPTTYDERSVAKKWKEESPSVVRDVADGLAALESWESPSIRVVLETVAAERDLGLGRVMAPVRIAISGSTSGPDLAASMEVLGPDVCVQRLRSAAAHLEKATTRT